MRRNTILAIALVAATALGCSGVQSAVDTVQGAAVSVLLPIDDEIALGAQLAAELEGEITTHQSAAVQDYVSELGQAVIAVAGDRDRRMDFTFTVVDDDETVNAFAMPGGYIYVYTGLMLQAETEAELMSVLCHEVAHVTQRHVAERLVAMYGLEQLASIALGEDPGLVAELAAQVAATGTLLRHSRAAETDADQVGFQYMVAANYAPQGFIDFFSRLTGGPRPPEFLSTHPNPESRIADIERLIGDGVGLPTRTNAEALAAIQGQL